MTYQRCTSERRVGSRALLGCVAKARVSRLIATRVQAFIHLRECSTGTDLGGDVYMAMVLLPIMYHWVCCRPLRSLSPY